MFKNPCPGSCLPNVSRQKSRAVFSCMNTRSKTPLPYQMNRIGAWGLPTASQSSSAISAGLSLKEQRADLRSLGSMGRGLAFRVGLSWTSLCAVLALIPVQQSTPLLCATWFSHRCDQMSCRNNVVEKGFPLLMASESSFCGCGADSVWADIMMGVAACGRQTAHPCRCQAKDAESSYLKACPLWPAPANQAQTLNISRNSPK